MKEAIETVPLVPARRGWVVVCTYCGEDANTGKFCKTCRSIPGREAIFKENIEVLKQLRAKGYCKGEVFLPSPRFETKKKDDTTNTKAEEKFDTKEEDKAKE